VKKARRIGRASRDLHFCSHCEDTLAWSTILWGSFAAGALPEHQHRAWSRWLTGTTRSWPRMRTRLRPAQNADIKCNPA